MAYMDGLHECLDWLCKLIGPFICKTSVKVQSHDTVHFITVHMAGCMDMQESAALTVSVCVHRCTKTSRQRYARTLH